MTSTSSLGPTAGFNLLRLLLDLNVSSTIHLIGFDLYQSGMHRLDDAAAVSHAPGHDSVAEKEWVLANAASRSGLIISMLPTEAFSDGSIGCSCDVSPADSSTDARVGRAALHS